MTLFIALMMAAFAAETRVTGLSVASVADRTEVVILVDGSVTARHFMLDDGRIVVDLTGVPTAPKQEWTEFNRGGIREMRLAPFQPNVARFVVALEERSDYALTRERDRIRISFPNGTGTFEAWNEAVATPASPVVEEPAPATVPTVTSTQQRSLTISRTQQQPPITITFRNEPLASVLGIFSEHAGRTIIPASDVQASAITAELRGVPWDVALEGILEANNLMMRTLPTGIILVESAARRLERLQQEETVTLAFPIQYISADSIRNAVAGLLSPAGRVTVNTASNSLLVTDAVSGVERVRQIIPQLDVKTPQVDISAVIAFIDRTALEAFGVAYDLKDSRGTQINRLVQGGQDTNGNGLIDADEQTGETLVSLGGASVAALGNAAQRVTGPSLEIITTLVLGRHSLISFIEALQTVSLSDIQAKPTVRTMDHRLASIQVGEQTPVRVIDAGAASGSAASAPRATVQFRNTGIILEVTPHVTGNQVMLDMRAERSNVAASASADVGLIFQTQNAQTQVLVNDGETTVIGGLTIVEKTRSRAGIPLLMDLPVIGRLFRNETERENKRDLLIMVTPHIVRN
jgi:type IV pilus assembly protein PilQ